MPKKSSEQARAEVRAAARDVLAERGVAGFSVDAVVERSGVAKTTIYRHWPSAHHLLVDTAAEGSGTMPTPNTGALRSDLIEILSTMAAKVDEPGMRARILDLLAASGRSGVDGSLWRIWRFSSGMLTAKSVKVPPTSTPMWICIPSPMSTCS